VRQYQAAERALTVAQNQRRLAVHATLYVFVNIILITVDLSPEFYRLPSPLLGPSSG
jgi:hypothetical protein